MVLAAGSVSGTAGIIGGDALRLLEEIYIRA